MRDARFEEIPIESGIYRNANREARSIIIDTNRIAYISYVFACKEIIHIYISLYLL